jgi:hypothetical protein
MSFEFSGATAAALLDELLLETGGLNHATTRNRTLAVGKRIEQEIRKEIDQPRVVPEPAERMVAGRNILPKTRPDRTEKSGGPALAAAIWLFLEGESETEIDLYKVFH